MSDPSLAPQFLGTRYGSCTARHVLEAYIDWACPFSAKQLFGFREHLVPRIDSDLRDDLAIVRASPHFLCPPSDGVQVIRASPQPWHASSTHLHEAFIAVTTSDPAKTWPFAYALMEHQKEFFDANVQDETPNATKARLAKLAGTVGADEKRILDLIKLTGESLNSGSKATNDLKLQVKLGR